jgi:hypothetical protein
MPSRRRTEITTGIVAYLRSRPDRTAHLSEIYLAIEKKMGRTPQTTIRMALQDGRPDHFENVRRGYWRAVG